MAGILKKKKSSGISLILRMLTAREKRKGPAGLLPGRKAGKGSLQKAGKTSLRKAGKTSAAAGLSKKDAAKAALAAAVMTKVEFGILKSVIKGRISKEVHSDRSKQLLCAAVERFLQL